MDHRDRNLAEPLVWRREYAYFGNGGAGVAGRLHFGRRDILAPADDDVLLPVDDEQIAVLVEIADVAGADVAVWREQRRRRFRRLPVAFDVGRGADRDFTDFARGQMAIALAEDRQLDKGLVRPPCGAGLRGIVGPEIVAPNRVGLGQA